MSINKNILYTFLSQIPIQLFGIVSGIFIARMIGPEGKGVFAIYQANAQLLTTFFSLSIGNGLTYFIPAGKIKPEKLLGISILITIIGSACIMLCLLFFNYSSFKDYLFPSNYSGFLYMAWLFLYSVLYIIYIIATGFFQGLKLFNTINKISIINSIINVLFFSTLFVFDKFNLIVVNVVGLLYGLLFVTFINAVQFTFPFFKTIKIRPNFNISLKNDIKPIFKYSLFTHLSLFVGFLNSRFSLWILNFYLNEIAIGLYSLASNLIIVFNMISQPIGNVLMPYLSNENKQYQQEMFFKYSRLNFTLIFLAAVCSFFIVIPLIPFLYGPAFDQSILLFQLLLPGILFIGHTRILSVYLAANNRQDYNLYATIFGFIGSVMSNYFLIKYFGLIGASIAGSITYIVICVSMMFFVHIKLLLPFGNYFFTSYSEWNKIMRLLLKR